MSIADRILNMSQSDKVERTNHRFSILESRLEVDVATSLPITKNLGDSLQVVSPKKLGANWPRFLDSKADKAWANYLESEMIAVDFISYIANHEKLDDPQFVKDMINWILFKINTKKLKDEGYHSEKAKIFGSFVALMPELSKIIYEGVNRSVKYFANQQENFTHLTDDQFAQFQKDYTEQIKLIGPGIVDAITARLSELMDGARNV